MVSSIYNNGYNLYDSFNLHQATTGLQNPSSDYYYHQDSPFTPYFDAFVGGGSDNSTLMMSQSLFEQQDHNFGSCSNTVLSPRNDADNANLDDGYGGGADECGGTEMREEVPRRRSSGRDRHRKVYTARGPRDRRMRLSLDIACKLFYVQDLLGFDKASMAIDWLLSESKASIMELIDRSEAATSGVDGQIIEHEMVGLEAPKRTTRVRRPKERKTPTKTVHRRMRRTKESRNEARKLARERTMMKRMNMRSGISVVGTMSGAFPLQNAPNCSQEIRPNVVEQRREQEQGQRQEHGLMSNVHFLEHQRDELRSIEKFLGIGSDSSSSLISGDSMGTNSEESYRPPPGNRIIGVSDGAQYCSTGNNIEQLQSPNLDEVFAFLAQNLHVSESPMVTRSSTVFES